MCIRARLAQFANAALEGHGAIVLVEGAVGVGKTRLLEIFFFFSRWRGFSVSWLKTGELPITSSSHPRILLIDDAHAAQTDFWDSMIDQASFVQKTALLMLLGGRSLGLRNNTNCWRTLVRLDDAARLEHCLLEGLSVTECTRLAHAVGARSSTRTISLLHQDTEGNPRQFLSALKSVVR